MEPFFTTLGLQKWLFEIKFTLRMKEKMIFCPSFSKFYIISIISFKSGSGDRFG